MQPRSFSRTALGVAIQRAAHQTLDDGAIFHDPFARAILGKEADALIASHATEENRHLRWFVAVRARFAEDSLAAAVTRNVRQVVVLGAGLDTFALRNPHADLAVFEVDHPASQEFKRERLSAAGLQAHDTMDNIRDTLAGDLEEVTDIHNTLMYINPPISDDQVIADLAV